jgi:hypothetical protein
LGDFARGFLEVFEYFGVKSRRLLSGPGQLVAKHGTMRSLSAPPSGAKFTSTPVGQQLGKPRRGHRANPSEVAAIYQFATGFLQVSGNFTRGFLEVFGDFSVKSCGPAVDPRQARSEAEQATCTTLWPISAVPSTLPGQPGSEGRPWRCLRRWNIRCATRNAVWFLRLRILYRETSRYRFRADLCDDGLVRAEPRLWATARPSQKSGGSAAATQTP